MSTASSNPVKTIPAEEWVDLILRPDRLHRHLDGDLRKAARSGPVGYQSPRPCTGRRLSPTGSWPKVPGISGRIFPVVPPRLLTNSRRSGWPSRALVRRSSSSMPFRSASFR